MRSIRLVCTCVRQVKLVLLGIRGRCTTVLRRWETPRPASKGEFVSAAGMQGCKSINQPVSCQKRYFLFPRLQDITLLWIGPRQGHITSGEDHRIVIREENCVGWEQVTESSHVFPL